FIFFIIYVFSFFWFKTPWKRWLLWAALIIFLGGGIKSIDDVPGIAQLLAVLLTSQVVRWGVKLVIIWFRLYTDKDR
ncbi:MAG TPA: hypothetical protein VGX93_04735, partial [Chthoniobacterales bacterium]|nr:hypothetical protein [Chthoniobacterales bacterium]